MRARFAQDSRGITKTDFVRGMQCPRMLWLDKHHPEYKKIPPEVQRVLDKGNELGDAAMGMFGPYTEVREYYPGTTRPDKKRMVEKTLELIDFGTPIICEAAFMDDAGNYCAVDILRKTDNGYEMFEVKNALKVTERFISDAGFQAHLIKERCGLPLERVSIVYNSGSPAAPYVIEDITDKAFACAQMVAENIDRLGAVKDKVEEVRCPRGLQCLTPYECWYADYCYKREKKDATQLHFDLDTGEGHQYG